MTNFYLTPGDKYGTGTSQSHARYDVLMGLDREKMSMDAMRDAAGQRQQGQLRRL